MRVLRCVKHTSLLISSVLVDFAVLVTVFCATVLLRVCVCESGTSLCRVVVCDKKSKGCPGGVLTSGGGAGDSSPVQGSVATHKVSVRTAKHLV